jgi:hypothetical protein|tara:strand:+ start:69 stop:215 length:147 start_codon:yes stop_codon:yes gene_type:complete
MTNNEGERTNKALGERRRKMISMRERERYGRKVQKNGKSSSRLKIDSL